MMTGFAILLFLSWVSAATDAQDPNQRLRDWGASGQTDAIRKLLAESGKVDIDSRDEGGWTALMYAVKAGHDAIVELLLDAGASVHLENGVKETALHLAAQHGRVEAARLLLEAGADFAARDADGRTPLYRAIEHRHAEIIELLHAAAQATAGRKRSGQETAPIEGTVPPQIVVSAPAPYTDSALEQGIEGTVVLMALVRRDGSVGAVSVSKSLEESLDRSALRAVRKWKFDPATRGGKLVEVIVEIKVDFKLPRKR
ncbi:MAG: TonB family protein [Acidobacteriota bacterium]